MGKPQSPWRYIHWHNKEFNCSRTCNGSRLNGKSVVVAGDINPIWFLDSSRIRPSHHMETLELSSLSQLKIVGYCESSEHDFVWSHHRQHSLDNSIGNRECRLASHLITSVSIKSWLMNLACEIWSSLKKPIGISEENLWLKSDNMC